MRVKTLKVSKTFRVYKAETSALTESIVRVEREIDRLVYKLYDLTPEEIAIVEESLRVKVYNHRSDKTRSDRYEKRQTNQKPQTQTVGAIHCG